MTNSNLQHETARILAKVRTTLRSEPRLGPGFHLRELRLEPDGALVLDGEVPSMAAKKLSLEHVAAALPEITCLIDRLHVRPATVMEDDEIRIHVRNGLLEEPGLKALEIREFEDNAWHLIRSGAEKTLGRVDIEVANGVVTLDGQVPGLTSKRLAGAIAWWVPGVRDVINGMAVEPSEDDSADMIAEAVRVVLERDPFVNASQISVDVQGRQVRLAGLVPNQTGREAAERDTWCIFGVDNVVNAIEVQLGV